VTAGALHVLGARSLAELLAARGAANAATVRDELTGCVNPRGLMMFAVQILEAARRQGDAVHCMFLAVDGIPRVTEAFGDEAGEDLLVAAADALRVSTRATDVVARWDTDVFVVLGPGRGTPVLQIERRVTAGLPMLTVPGPGPRVLAAGALLPPWDAGTIDSLLHKGAEQLAGRRSMRRRSADARPAVPPATSPPPDAPPSEKSSRP
jgi:diguanylate cyclase (GGDEF)-like protein